MGVVWPEYVMASQHLDGLLVGAEQVQVLTSKLSRIGGTQ